MLGTRGKQHLCSQTGCGCLSLSLPAVPIRNNNCGSFQNPPARLAFHTPPPPFILLHLKGFASHSRKINYFYKKEKKKICWISNK